MFRKPVWWSRTSKVEIYRGAGSPEYSIFNGLEPDAPCRPSDYRLSAVGTYQRLAPEADGAIVSEQVGLRFCGDAQAPCGLRIEDLESGEALRSSQEEAETRRRAEAEAVLRAELERLKSSR